MISRAFSFCFLLFSLYTALPCCALAQISDPVGINITSDIRASGDRLNADATCETSTVFDGITARSLSGIDYRGFSTVCTVTSHDGSIVSRSLDQQPCNMVTATFPEIGQGNFGNPKSSCRWTFPVQPGETYLMTTQHYVWLYQGGDPNAPYACPIGTFADPLNWSFTGIFAVYPKNVLGTTRDIEPFLFLTMNRDRIQSNFRALRGSAASERLHRARFVLAAQTSQDNGQCTPADFIMSLSGNDSGAVLAATTYATFTAISITPSTTSLVQTQGLHFTDNLSDLSALAASSDEDVDDMNWCILASPKSCSKALTDLSGLITPLGLFHNLVSAPSANVLSGGAAQNFAANSSFLAPVTQLQYVCVEETDDAKNYACSAVSFNTMKLNLSPGSGTLTQQNVMAGQSFTFTANVNSYGLPIVWTWLIAPPPNGSGTSGTPTLTAESGQSSFMYRADDDPKGFIDVLTVQGLVQVPGAFDTLAPLTGTVQINIVSASTPQNVIFRPVSGQTAFFTVPLFATASSGLPVEYTSLSPAVCSVAGSLATGIGGGLCTVAATQAGNATYSSATASQAFNIYPGGQGASLGSFLISGSDASQPNSIWDRGSITLTVNNQTETFGYGQFSTPASIAAGLAAYFSRNGSSPVVAKATGSTVTFYSRTSPTVGFAASSSVAYDTQNFQGPSFVALVQ